MPKTTKSSSDRLAAELGIASLLSVLESLPDTSEHRSMVFDHLSALTRAYERPLPAELDSRLNTFLRKIVDDGDRAFAEYFRSHNAA